MFKDFRTDINSLIICLQFGLLQLLKSTLEELNFTIINHQAKGQGNTLLMEACDREFDIVAEYLLQHGADPNLQNTKKSTALHIAVQHSNVQIVELLLANGASVHISDDTGCTPIAKSKSQQITKLLQMAVFQDNK
jgi:ankyrin repeat protein